MKPNMYAFISYQTADKEIAGRIKEILQRVGIKAFLAHEDIEVSEEWAEKILKEIRKADFCICLLSKNFLESSWCLQESGIAAFRKKMTIIPLSIDGRKPEGFIAKIQSTKIDASNLYIHDLIPGIVKHNFKEGISIIIDIIGKSGSYRGAEANFQMILPYIDKLKDYQIKKLLEHAVSNNQVNDAGLCAREYIPPLLKSHGHLLKEKDRAFLQSVCNKYALDSKDMQVAERLSDDQVELIILQKAVEQHKIAETNDKLKTDKCAREINLADILSDLTGESGPTLEYSAKLWLNRVAPRGKPAKGPLRRCSNTQLNREKHKYHVRAFVDASGRAISAWERIRELKEKIRRGKSEGG